MNALFKLEFSAKIDDCVQGLWSPRTDSLIIYDIYAAARSIRPSPIRTWTSILGTVD